MCVVYIIFFFFFCLKKFEDSYTLQTIYFLIPRGKVLNTLENFIIHDNDTFQLVNETRFFGEVIASKINHTVTLVEPRACRVFSRQTIGGGRIRRFYRFDDKTVGSPSPFYL